MLTVLTPKMQRTENKKEEQMNKREEILQAIIGYIQNHGYPPSVREIGEMVGLKSTSTVHAHLTRMFEEGLIETDSEYGTPRAIRVPGYAFVKVGDAK